MKELFTGFFSVSLSGSIIILLIVLLRLILKKSPKALICLLWGLAILRLLLPFQIQSSISLRPETPVLNQSDTQLFVDAEPVSEDALPDFLPQSKVEVNEDSGNWMVQIDYVAIATAVWATGICTMLLYMLTSYLRLRHRVKEAILLEKSVYTSAQIDSAFLLGYFRPRIYLPETMDVQSQAFVIAHERAHIKRGDNWLKLIGFICLSLHWFNPFVWLAYMLLCRDIEDACDEYVVRKLDVQERKAYSSALLSCSQRQRRLSGCPVAFGEISIRQRILNVLNYRKPTVWISAVAIVAIAVIAVFFMTDPVQKNPPYYDELTQLLGQKKAVVLSELGLSEDDVTEDDLTHYIHTPITVEYLGISFSLDLGFDRTEDPILMEFHYTASYVDNAEQAAKDIVTLSRSRWNVFGEGYQAEQKKDTDILSYITEEEVFNRIMDNMDEHLGTDIVYDLWDITEQSGSSVKEYLEDVEMTELWQASYGEPREARFHHVFSAYYDTQNEKANVVVITLQYRTRPGQRQDMVYATYVEEQTWWDKLLNWSK